MYAPTLQYYRIPCLYLCTCLHLGVLYVCKVCVAAYCLFNLEDFLWHFCGPAIMSSVFIWESLNFPLLKTCSISHCIFSFHQFGCVLLPFSVPGGKSFHNLAGSVSCLVPSCYFLEFFVTFDTLVIVYFNVGQWNLLSLLDLSVSLLRFVSFISSIEFLALPLFLVLLRFP